MEGNVNHMTELSSDLILEVDKTWSWYSRDWQKTPAHCFLLILSLLLHTAFMSRQNLSHMTKHSEPNSQWIALILQQTRDCAPIYITKHFQRVICTSKFSRISTVTTQPDFLMFMAAMMAKRRRHRKCQVCSFLVYFDHGYHCLWDQKMLRMYRLSARIIQKFIIISIMTYTSFLLSPPSLTACRWAFKCFLILSSCSFEEPRLLRPRACCKITSFFSLTVICVPAVFVPEGDIFIFLPGHLQCDPTRMANFSHILKLMGVFAYCCRPCQSIYDNIVPIFWWLLPVGLCAMSQSFHPSIHPFSSNYPK